MEMTMTFGDLMVAAGTVIAVLIAYYAIKSALGVISASIAELVVRVSEHPWLLLPPFPLGCVRTLRIGNPLLCSIPGFLWFRKPLDVIVSHYVNSPC